MERDSAGYVADLRTNFLSLDRKNVIGGDMKPNNDATIRLGSPTKRFHTVYADRIVSDNISGSSGGSSSGHADTLGDDYLTATAVAIIGDLYPLQDDGVGNPVFPSSVLPDDVAYQNSVPTFTSINVTNYVDGLDVGSHTHSGAANMGLQINHANLTNLSADHHTIYTRWDDTETIIKKWKFSNVADENQDFNEYVGWEVEASVAMVDDSGWKPVMSTAQAVLQTLAFTDPSYPTYEHYYPLQIISHAEYAAITLGSGSEILIKTNDTDTWIDVGNITLSDTDGITIGSTFEVTQAGALTSTSGYIADWQILSDKLQSTSGDVILDGDGYIQLSGGGDTEIRMSSFHADYRFWLGAEGESTWDETTSKFMVNPAGQVTAETLALKGLIHNYGSDKWKITSDGHAEFESITARGRLDTLVFTKSAVSSIAGIISLSKGAVLSQDITDSQTYMYVDSPEFEFGDIVLLQPSADEIEWLLIVSSYTPTIIQNADGEDIDVFLYTISRDFDDIGTTHAYTAGVSINGRGSYAAGNDPLPMASGDAQGAFGEYQPSGTFAGAGGGWITLDGEKAFMQVDVRTGPLPHQYQSFIRIGNLQGILNYTSIEWGFAIGDENNYLTYDQTDGLKIYSRDGSTTINEDGITSDGFLLSLVATDPVSHISDTAILYFEKDTDALQYMSNDSLGSGDIKRTLATETWVTANSLQDIVEDTSPELGADLDAKDFGIINLDRIDLDQSVDDDGISIFGYDDMSAEFLKLSIDSSGYSVIEADAKLSVVSGSSGDIFIHSANEIILELGDAAGADTVSITDSGSTEVASIDSDGHGTFVSADMQRTAVVLMTGDSTILEAGDNFGDFIFTVPAVINGYNLTDVEAYNETPSTSGIPTFQLHNVTDAVDMLSTKLTIDANEQNSNTAATAVVINGSYDNVATGDRLRWDCDVDGTAAAGISFHMVFALP